MFAVGSSDFSEMLSWMCTHIHHLQITLDILHKRKEEEKKNEQDFFVYFSDELPTVPVRLVGGSNANEGRIEVFFNNVWGSVCMNGFNEKEAGVVCRQLGFPSSNAQIKRSDAAFGVGSGPIWLSNVQCLGSESSLNKCFHNGWGYLYNCDSAEAGIICASGMY